MRTRTIRTAQAFAASIALALPVALAPPASAQGGSCPSPASGFRLWDVNNEPYQADNASDVNSDGYVCARPTKASFEQGGQTYTVFLFVDDNVRG